MTILVHDLISARASAFPEQEALRYQNTSLTYAALLRQVKDFAAGLATLGIQRGDRIGIYLPKQLETVVGLLGCSAAGAVFVPINPALKPTQVAHILRDCNTRVLVTSTDRLSQLAEVLRDCHDLHGIILTGGNREGIPTGLRVPVTFWDDILATDLEYSPPRAIDADIAAILYTSGSTGKPKGVVLSHRNILVGASSVAHYLKNQTQDRILLVLPLSFDYGLSQLTTAFSVGACVVLMNYLLPRDVIRLVEKERITGLAAVPPVWIQLAQLPWPDAASHCLRYITNSGGAMPEAILAALRRALPTTDVYLMYGLTEAFRSTYLPPDQLDKRPTSIGKAIPNAEVMVVREDGSPCAPHEPGELVHRGALVSLGYWNDPQKTAERFRPAPSQNPNLPLTEIAVWSGDTVRMDEEGYLYFVARRDEMIKTSGYRVSPTEVEEVLYASGLVGIAVVLGLAHPALGEGIVAVVAPPPEQVDLDGEALLAYCRAELPTFMVPAKIVVDDAMPTNPNGKIDRPTLRAKLQGIFIEEQA